MPSALSVDLRERVVAVIEEVHRARPWATTGTCGDRNLQRLDAQAALILRANEEHPQYFLCELRDVLAARGVRAGMSSLSRVFALHEITLKKGLPTEPSRSGRT